MIAFNVSAIVIVLGLAVLGAFAFAPRKTPGGAPVEDVVEDVATAEEDAER